VSSKNISWTGSDFARNVHILPSCTRDGCLHLAREKHRYPLVHQLAMNAKRGSTVDDAIAIDEDASPFSDILLNAHDVSRERGRGFVSIGSRWLDKHDAIPHWVYETNVLLNKRWPRYALLVKDTYPRLELIEPRKEFGKRNIKLFRTLSADPWIRSCMGNRLRPISDGYMCLLVDMHRVRLFYPAIFESILFKLYYGDIPFPDTGPLVLLKEIGLKYAIQQCSQIALSRSCKSREASIRSHDWSPLNAIIYEFYGYWYDKHKSQGIQDLFSRIPIEGEFIKALEQTLSNSFFYAEIVWKIAVDTKSKGLEWTDTRDAIKDWSENGAASWYTPV
jgi:hypothetical protein